MKKADVFCAGCEEKLDPSAATNYYAPHSHVAIERSVYQFDNGTEDVRQDFDFCADCMRKFYVLYPKAVKK